MAFEPVLKEKWKESLIENLSIAIDDFHEQVRIAVISSINQSIEPAMMQSEC